MHKANRIVNSQAIELERNQKILQSHQRLPLFALGTVQYHAIYLQKLS